MSGAVLTVEEAVQLVRLARVIPMRPRSSEAVIALLRAREARAPEPVVFSPQQIFGEQCEALKRALSQ